jgi:hypothetical protein
MSISPDAKYLAEQLITEIVVLLLLERMPKYIMINELLVYIT